MALLPIVLLGLRDGGEKGEEAEVRQNVLLQRLIAPMPELPALPRGTSTIRTQIAHLHLVAVREERAWRTFAVEIGGARVFFGVTILVPSNKTGTTVLIL